MSPGPSRVFPLFWALLQGYSIYQNMLQPVSKTCSKLRDTHLGTPRPVPTIFSTISPTPQISSSGQAAVCLVSYRKLAHCCHLAFEWHANALFPTAIWILPIHEDPIPCILLSSPHPAILSSSNTTTKILISMCSCPNCPIH